EWIIALWGCVLEGAVLVPIDYRASADFLLRVGAIVDARVGLAGDSVDLAALGSGRPIWHLAELRDVVRLKADTTADNSPGLVAPKPRTEEEAAKAEESAATADDTAESIFTSGGTGGA